MLHETWARAPVSSTLDFLLHGLIVIESRWQLDVLSSAASSGFVGLKTADYIWPRNRWPHAYSTEHDGNSSLTVRDGIVSLECRMLSFSLPLFPPLLSPSPSTYIPLSSLTEAQSYTVPTNRASPILCAVTTDRRLLLAFRVFEPRFTAITFHDFPRIRRAVRLRKAEQ